MSNNTLLFLTTLCLSVAGVYSQPIVEPPTFVDNGQLAVNYTCKCTLKDGEILAWYQRNWHTLTIKKTDTIYVGFRVGGTSVVVPVRAAQDAAVRLLHDGVINGHSYKIAIGVNNNTESYIAKGYTINIKIQVPTPEILTEHEFRRFRISWDKGLIRVIAMWRQGNDSIVMEWQDPEPSAIYSYSVIILGDNSGEIMDPGIWWYSWHTLLNMVQHHGQEQLVTLPLDKTLEDYDSDMWLYCAKQSVKPGGAFTQISRMLDGSPRILLEIEKKKSRLETPIIKLEPNHDIVNFTENSTLTLTCSGSPPVDGRTYTWFRKVSKSDLSLPENQCYDAAKSRNILMLTPDKSYNNSEIFCRQGYVGHYKDPNGVYYIKSYRELATSKTIILNMIETVETEPEEPEPKKPEPKEPDDDLSYQKWVVLGVVLALLAMMLFAMGTIFVLTTSCCSICPAHVSLITITSHFTRRAVRVRC